MKGKDDMWDNALEQFNSAADKLGLDDGTRQVLSHCKRELTVHFPVKMSGNVVKVFTGYRVHHNVISGPSQGRHPVSPGRHSGRGEGAGDADDLEVRGGGHPLRRRQGRRHRRSPAAEVSASWRT